MQNASKREGGSKKGLRAGDSCFCSFKLEKNPKDRRRFAQKRSSEKNYHRGAKSTAFGQAGRTGRISLGVRQLQTTSGCLCSQRRVP